MDEYKILKIHTTNTFPPYLYTLSIPNISKRISAVQSPIIPAVADLIAANPGTISLGQGVVYYKPPSQIEQGITKFKRTNSHIYEPVEGTSKLRELIGIKLQSENGIDTDQYEIVVSAGSNMGFLNAILAICDSGDEVILLKPWYFNHDMAITMAECEPVSIDTDLNYQPILENLAKAITPRTRAIVTVSPNNPTGAVYSSHVLMQINDLCTSSNIYHISDEAYEYFCYNKAKHYSPASSKTASAHTISLFSTSKSFALANWRIGYMLIPKHLFKPVRKIQDTNLICPPVISQFAAIECLQHGYCFCEPKISEIKRVRDYFQKRLNAVPEVNCPALDGAFYGLLQLPNISLTDMDIVKYLIEKHQVAVIPGSAFGITDFRAIRVSYGALKPDSAVEGIDRLVSGLTDLFGSQPA